MLGYGDSIGEFSLTVQYCRSVQSIRFLEDLSPVDRLEQVYSTTRKAENASRDQSAGVEGQCAASYACYQKVCALPTTVL